MEIIRAVNIEQRRDSRVLLKNINLEIEKGEIFVIIGPTGAGKTTLLRIFDLLDKPYSGDIFFDDFNAAAEPNRIFQMRRRMAMVFQKPAVFNTSVYENIAYPLKVRFKDGKMISSRVNHMLEITGLQGYGKRKAKTLSGGEAQRVAIARAMISDPEVLLLDEPTANLDPLSVNIIEDLILDFNRKSGVTIVMATHDLHQGQRLAQRVGVLMHTELIQVGRPLEIFYSPGSIEIASFVGIGNIMSGSIVAAESGIVTVNAAGSLITGVSALPAGTGVDIYIRPEDITLSRQALLSSARNVLSCRIKTLSFAESLCHVHLECGFTLIALLTRKSAEEMHLKEGENIYASFKATAVKIILRKVGT